MQSRHHRQGHNLGLTFSALCARPHSGARSQGPCFFSKRGAEGGFGSRLNAGRGRIRGGGRWSIVAVNWPVLGGVGRSVNTTHGAGNGGVEACTGAWARVVTDMPKAKCPTHGVLFVPVPWAGRGIRFTALFEASAIELMRECSIRAAAQRLNISWGQASAIQARAVTRGLARCDVQWRKWLSRVQCCHPAPMAKVVQTVRNHLHGVMTAASTGIMSARTESVNSKWTVAKVNSPRLPQHQAVRAGYTFPYGKAGSAPPCACEPQ